MLTLRQMWPMPKNIIFFWQNSLSKELWTLSLQQLSTEQFFALIWVSKEAVLRWLVLFDNQQLERLEVYRKEQCNEILHKKVKCRGARWWWRWRMTRGSSLKFSWLLYILTWYYCGIYLDSNKRIHFIFSDLT